MIDCIRLRRKKDTSAQRVKELTNLLEGLVAHYEQSTSRGEKERAEFYRNEMEHSLAELKEEVSIMVSCQIQLWRFKHG